MFSNQKDSDVLITPEAEELVQYENPEFKLSLEIRESWIITEFDNYQEFMKLPISVNTCDDIKNYMIFKNNADCNANTPIALGFNLQSPNGVNIFLYQLHSALK